MEVLGSLIIAIIQTILFYGKNIGISMFIFTMSVTSIIWFILYKNKKIINKKSILLMIPIILLSATYLIFTDTVFYIANIVIIFALIILMYTIATNKQLYLKEYLRKSFKVLLDTLEELDSALHITKMSIKNNVKINKKLNKEKVKKVVTSFIIVSVVVGIVIALLASADKTFAGIFSGITNSLQYINKGAIWSFVLRIALIIITYFITLGFLIAIQKKNEITNKEIKEIHKDKFTIKMLLFALNIVYLVFCYIQFSSLFTKVYTAGTFNYAEYARSGFFQLMIVSFINFILILISNKDNENRAKIIKILNVCLILFTIIIILSSMYRMYMYEVEYGLTYLRILVYIILVTELLVFMPTILYVFSAKIDLLKWLGIITLGVYTCINYINIENIIVERNINRKYTKISLDYNYLCNIATSNSYDKLDELLKQNNIETKDKLTISKKLLNLANNNKNRKWQEFNISKYQFENKNINIQELENLVSELQNKLKEESKNKTLEYSHTPYYIYEDMINDVEGYRVDQIDATMGDAAWKIEKTINGGKSYTEINTIDVKTPSKIKFFENGLGFLEKPTSIYCEAASLYITFDSGKSFTKINFPSGEFTLSNPEGKKWIECYDYFYLPKEADGRLIVYASGGYEGGYNEGKTRAKYISNDKGKTWKFEKEVLKEEAN